MQQRRSPLPCWYFASQVWSKVLESLCLGAVVKVVRQVMKYYSLGFWNFVNSPNLGQILWEYQPDQNQRIVSYLVCLFVYVLCVSLYVYHSNEVLSEHSVIGYSENLIFWLCNSNLVISCRIAWFQCKECLKFGDLN